MNAQDTNAVEIDIATRLVDQALSLGYFVTVYDEEGLAQPATRDRASILDVMHECDTNTLDFSQREGSALMMGRDTVVGSVLIIWGEGETIITDYTASPVIEALVDHAMANTSYA